MPVTQRAIQDLIDKRQQLWSEAQALLEDPSEENNAKFDEAMDEVERLGKQIERHTRAREAEAENDRLRELRERGERSRGTSGAGRPDSEPEKEDERGENPEGGESDPASYRAALNSYMVGGHQGLTRQQAELLRADPAELRELRMQSGNIDVSGGVLVQPNTMQPLVEAQKEWGSLRQAGAHVLTTDNGASIPYPVANETEKMGMRVGSTRGQAKKTEVEFGKNDLDTFYYTSGYIEVQWALLEDTSFDFVDYVFRVGGERIERRFQHDALLNEEEGGPRGIIPIAQVGAVSDTSDKVGWIDCVSLETAVDPAYRNSPSCRYMFSNETYGLLKRERDLDQRPLWVPGAAFGQPDTINGHRYVINQYMADPTSSAKGVVLFGDFRNVHIRDVNKAILLRLTEVGALNTTTVLLIYRRHGSLYVDGGGGAIKRLDMKPAGGP